MIKMHRQALNYIVSKDKKNDVQPGCTFCTMRQTNPIIELFGSGQIQEALDALDSLSKVYPNDSLLLNIYWGEFNLFSSTFLRSSRNASSYP